MTNAKETINAKDTMNAAGLYKYLPIDHHESLIDMEIKKP